MNKKISFKSKKKPALQDNAGASILQEFVLRVSRVSKTTKGGRIPSFSAVVVIGNKEGRVGYGLGKANEASKAILKGVEDAKKKLIDIKIPKGTIPHEVIGKFGSSTVKLFPASKGTGLVAGSAVRVGLEAAGVQDVLSKIIGSKNPVNVIRAVFDGFSKMRDALEISRVRKVSLDKVYNG